MSGVLFVCGGSDIERLSALLVPGRSWSIDVLGLLLATDGLVGVVFLEEFEEGAMKGIKLFNRSHRFLPGLEDRTLSRPLEDIVSGDSVLSE